MSLAKSYQKSLEQQWCLRLRTKHPDGDNYDGVITHVKKSFVVLREERELEFDGLIILKKEFIKSCRDGKFEKCINEILQSNGAMKKCRSPKWINNCGTPFDVMTAIQRRGIWPGIETLFNDGKDSAFYLGPITQVNKNSFSIYCYDAAGKWEQEYELEYAEIFRIEIDSIYCNHFNRYMRSVESTNQILQQLKN